MDGGPMHRLVYGVLFPDECNHGGRLFSHCEASFECSATVDLHLLVLLAIVLPIAVCAASTFGASLCVHGVAFLPKQSEDGGMVFNCFLVSLLGHRAFPLPAVPEVAF